MERLFEETFSRLRESDILVLDNNDISKPISQAKTLDVLSLHVLDTPHTILALVDACLEADYVPALEPSKAPKVPFTDGRGKTKDWSYEERKKLEIWDKENGHAFKVFSQERHLTSFSLTGIFTVVSIPRETRTAQPRFFSSAHSLQRSAK